MYGSTQIEIRTRCAEKEQEPGWINLKYDTDWLTIPHQWFIIERHTCASPHRRRRPRQIRENQEGLTTHLWALCRDDADHFSVGREKRVELGAEFFFVDLVVEVVDVEGCVGLDGWVHFEGLRVGLVTVCSRTTGDGVPTVRSVLISSRLDWKARQTSTSTPIACTQSRRRFVPAGDLAYHGSRGTINVVVLT